MWRNVDYRMRPRMRLNLTKRAKTGANLTNRRRAADKRGRGADSRSQNTAIRASLKGGKGLESGVRRAQALQAPGGCTK